MYIVKKNDIRIDKFNFSKGKLIHENNGWIIRVYDDETFEFRQYTVFYDESAAQEYADGINEDELNKSKYMEDHHGFKDNEPQSYRVVKLTTYVEGHKEKINLFPHIQ